MFCMLKKKKYILLIFQIIIQIVKRVILLIFPKREKWLFLAVKNLPALLRGITSKNDGDFYCLNCLHSFRTKNKLELYKRLYENKDVCNVIMPFEGT